MYSDGPSLVSWGHFPRPPETLPTFWLIELQNMQCWKHWYFCMLHINSLFPISLYKSVLDLIWASFACSFPPVLFLVTSQELIPEFYYLPEVFVNSNGYCLGDRDDGVPVCDVELPAWAKKPEDFVRINRTVSRTRYITTTVLFITSPEQNLHILDSVIHKVCRYSSGL